MIAYSTKAARECLERLTADRPIIVLHPSIGRSVNHLPLIKMRMSAPPATLRAATRTRIEPGQPTLGDSRRISAVVRSAPTGSSSMKQAELRQDRNGCG
jgi:hypothetical protein